MPQDRRLLLTSDVLEEEMKEIRPDMADKALRERLDKLKKDRDARSPGERLLSPEEEERRRVLYAELANQGLSALCLSGGGIRSASFALGVLQELAESGWLGKFDYLSTVSGGGYIGGWLSAWLHRPDPATGALPSPQAVYTDLAERAVPDRETRQIEWLRSYTSYLTPRVGLMSADTWTGIALYVRNLLLNWLVLLTLIGAVLLAPKFVVFWVHWSVHEIAMSELFFAVFAASTVVALVFATRNRPSWWIANDDERRFLSKDLLPMAVGALAWAIFGIVVGPLAHGTSPGAVAGLGALLGGAIYGLAWVLALAEASLIGPLWQQTPTALNKQRAPLLDLVSWLLAGGTFGAVLLGGSWFYWSRADVQQPTLVVAAIVLSIAPAWVIFAHLCAEVVFLGLRSYDLHGDDEREWFARSAGWYGKVALGWAIALGVILFAGYALEEARRLLEDVAPAGILSGLVTIFLGKSSRSSTVPTIGGKQGTLASYAIDIALAVAAPIFAAAIAILLSVGLDLAVFQKSFFHVADDGDALLRLAIAILVLLVIGVPASFFVNINRFSMHAVYRNRLIRCYLGASNTRREPDLFTGFDTEGDNVRVTSLWQAGSRKEKNGPKAPLHLINMALNLVGGRNLAWQQRKAEAFLVSPLACGSDEVGYRPTNVYGDPNGGISLGTAVAISGAAVSPNMGYHSSPGVGFLMTLFNVRLGWWLGNPGRNGEKTFTLDGPRFGIRPLLAELFGLTDDTSPYVYLSDGGHFENLGLYEVIRRRCRFVVVSDAGCDGAFAFEDLGNAVRKIAVDLGVRIEFPNLQELKKRGEAGEASRYFTTGVIIYPEGEEGQILYLKPGYHGNENADIRSYAVAHEAFPHESTGDQWFTEAQFEAYRALGRHVMRQAIAANTAGFFG